MTVRLACQRGDCVLVRRLLDCGGDANETSDENDDGQTVLMEVAKLGNASVAEVLLSFADDIVTFFDKACRDPASILHYAAPFVDFEDLKRGARVDDVDFSGRSALWIAARNGRLEIARMLADRGANIDSRSESGRTPLFIACRMDEVSIVSFLLSRGANPNLETKFGSTPLDACVQNDRAIELAKLLLDAGAHVDSKGIGCTPLYAACQAGFVNLAKLLIDRGADVNKPAKNGITCLEIAMRGTHSFENQSDQDVSCRRLLLESMLLERGAELR